MTSEELKQEFKEESGTNWKNSQGEPDIDYVAWLESRVIGLSSSNSSLKEVIAKAIKTGHEGLKSTWEKRNKNT